MTEGSATGRVSLRVPPDVMKRSDALRKKLAKDPKYSTLGKVTSSMVLKIALARGLEALEAEYK